MSSEERRYSQAEVKTILDRALQREDADGLTHGELLEVAREVGISPEALESAAADLREVQEQQRAREQILQRRRRHFFVHLRIFFAVQVFLIAINLLTSPHALWFVFPLLSWSLALFFAAQFGLSKHVSDRQLQREQKRTRRYRPARRALGSLRAGEPRLPSPSRTLERAGEEFGAAVEEGVGVVLRKLAEEIRKGIDPGPTDSKARQHGRTRVEGDPPQSAADEPRAREDRASWPRRERS